MRRLLRIALGLLALLALAIVALLLWVRAQAVDDGPEGRPQYGRYTWDGTQPPRGGPTPRADGYVMGSHGNDFILPPMPPARAADIHTAASVYVNSKQSSCFWPGPKLRPGFYSTDPDDYGIENQLPDTMNTFDTAWFRIPEGAHLVVKGQFPHMRHWSFTTYTEDGVPRDVIDDRDIDPDAGSSNPFRDGVRRDVEPRAYTFSIANGEPPNPRPRNTVYTRAAAGVAIGMHMRNYVPDQGRDFLGGAGVPQVELRMADGKLLTGEAACEASAAPLRGKQVPLAIPVKTWAALNKLPWRPADRTPAHDFSAEPMERFFNREFLVLKSFFPMLALDRFAVDKGGFWSNLSTRYGYKYISQAYGKVYVVRGKMPSVPHTLSGNSQPMDQHADMRYWSMCTTAAPPTGMTVDCVFDEGVTPTLDDKGYFTVVVTRAPDRPANATERCGVVWMEWGNGDGIPGGSKDFGVIINRHTQVNRDFKTSWFAVKKPGEEVHALGAYTPYVLNLREKANFEALGCPVDRAKLDAMVAH